MQSNDRGQRRRGGIFLVALALVAGGLLAYVEDITRWRIADNEAAHRLRALRAVLPEGRYDNEPHLDMIEVLSPDLLGSKAPLPVYRARLGETPVAVVLTAIAPDGFSDEIRILVGISADGYVIGVRVVAHSETPGLGDRIEIAKSDWILSFSDLKTDNLLAPSWVLRRDGGGFDHLSGATVTSRAVVNAVRNAVSYFNANSVELLANKPPADGLSTDSAAR